MSEQTSAEKRKTPRVKTHVPVRYRALRGGAGTFGSSAITKNLSTGGTHFKAPEFISMSCRLIVELDIPMFNKPIKAISKVAWLRKSPSGKEYEVGNQFLEMSKKDKELISEYVDSLNMYNDPVSSDSGTETDGTSVSAEGSLGEE